jgi:hypothetical protein
MHGIALGASVLVWCSAAANAQNALGGGNALDRDLTMKQRHGQGAGALDANSQVGAGRVNVNAARTDFYSRNLIVTGDVAGGRGFRGNVGYVGQSDFTAATGSDATRQWDAYSVMSSPMAIRSGLDPYKATQQYGAVLYTRAYADASARDILTNQQPLDARLAFDRFTAAGMKMSRQADLIDAANPLDTASRVNTRVEGKIPNAGPEAGAGAAGASAAGVPSSVPVDSMLSRLGLSTYERQRLKQDVLSGRTNMNLVGQDYDRSAMIVPGSLADTQRLNPVLPLEYRAVVDTMRQRAGMEAREPGADWRGGSKTGQGAEGTHSTAPTSTIPDRTTPDSTTPGGTTPGTVKGSEAAGGASAAEAERFNQEMDWLRFQLSRSGPDAARFDTSGDRDPMNPSNLTKPTTKAGAERADGSVNEQGTRAADGTDAAGTAQGAQGDAKNGDAKKGDAKPERRTIEEMALILRHGGRMESLVPEDAGYIHDMMDLGSQCMQRGDYFRAEELFGSVLRVIPGHPLALAGVANSELGAGLSLSAALTLRKTFAAHPEMIGTRFGPEVLPAAARMKSGLEAARMRLRAASAPDAGPRLAGDRFDYGLLIAYIGYQLDEAEVVNEGLSAMRAARVDDPLVKVLERVWLPEIAPAAEPAAAQPPAP